MFVLDIRAYVYILNIRCCMSLVNTGTLGSQPVRICWAQSLYRSKLKIVRGDPKAVYIHPHCFSYTMEQPSEIGEIAAFRHRVSLLPGMWSPADSRTNAGQHPKPTLALDVMTQS